MKYIYKITFWQSTIYLKYLLVGLCSLMKTTNFHHTLINTSNLFRQFINTPPDLHVQKNTLTQGKLFPRAVLPQIHWTQSMVRNTWPYQVSILLWFQTSVQKFPTLWASWCKSTKGICLKLILNCPFFVICRIFSLCLARYFILNRHCKASFIMGLIFFVGLSFDIFHLAVFCHINICIVKQTYINFRVCSLHTCDVKLIISLWGLCVQKHALICKYHVSSFFITFSFHWLVMIVLNTVLQDW